MKIVVLGGAGMMGCIIVQDLVESEGADQVVIADQNEESARQVAEYLDSSSIVVEPLNFRDHEALVNLLRGAKVCVNATFYHHNLEIMGACFEAGSHYTDLGGLFHTTQKQLQLHQQFKSLNLSAILGAGSSPGISNVHCRYAADRLDTMDSIRIYEGSLPSFPDREILGSTLSMLLDGLTVPPLIFRGGEFRSSEPLAEQEDYWFTPPIGLRPAHLAIHSEAATLPYTFKQKGLRECVYKTNHWGLSSEMVEQLKVLTDFGFSNSDPVQVLETSVAPRELLVAMTEHWVPLVSSYLEPSGQEPPDWVHEVVTEVKGARFGQEVTYRLGSLALKSTLPAGASASIVAQWLAEGRFDRGVFPPEAVLEPEPFFAELKKRGMPTQVTVTEPL